MTTAQTRFRAVALLGLIAAIAQVTLGGIVRVTGSGDACPDWPLCHGQLIPPLDYHTMLEYSHRLSATVVGLLVVIALYLAWRHYRGSSPALISTSVGNDPGYRGGNSRRADGVERAHVVGASDSPGPR